MKWRGVYTTNFTSFETKDAEPASLTKVEKVFKYRARLAKISN